MRADILSRRPSPPLQVDAQIPLTEGGEVDHTKSEGFKKAKATLSPAFSSAVTEYVVDVPAGTTHVNVMATSFSGASVKIADVPGNMCCVDIRGGVSAVPITLELNGAVAATYVLRPNVTADTAADARVVMHEKPPVAPEDAPAHVHMHGGVPCTADHGEDGEDGHDHSHKHGHSHDGGKTECHEDDGHGHEHGHSHDGGKTECHEDHGHGHGEKKEEHGHGHGHGHGEKKEEHGHGHGH